MGSCLTIIHTCFPFPPSRQISPCVPNVVKVSEDAAWVYTSFILIASGKSRSTRGASHQLAFRGSCLTIMRMCLPYLPNRLVSPCILRPLLIRLMGLLTFFSNVEYDFSSMESCCYFREWYGILLIYVANLQNYVALLHGSKITVGFH